MPVKGWNKATNEIWVVNIPDVRTKRLYVGQFWLDKELQVQARYPNYDPANPYAGGWSFVANEGPSGGAFGAAISRIHNAGDWVEWNVNAPADGTYRVAFYYSAQNAQFGYNNMAGRTSLQVGANQPVAVQNLPDTGGFNYYRWSTVASVQLVQGQQTLRWSNLQGGGLNLDAIALSDDPNWNPAGRVLARPGPGRQLIVVQAESMSASQTKEMVVPDLPPPAFKDHFQFREGDIKAYSKSPEPEVHVFPASGWVNEIAQVRNIDMDKRMVYLQPNVNASQEIRAGNRYYIANVFEELDSPGEWYLDRPSGNLYYWPSKASFQNLPAYIPVLDHLVEFKGDAARNKWVESFAIKGLEFSHTTYSRTPSAYAANDAAIWMGGAKGCILESNRFVNLGGYAVRLENRSTGNEIVGNEMAHLGEGGVIMTGTASTQAKGNLIEGNWIHHLGEVYKHVAGVYVTTGSGNRIAHNQFEYLPRYAVSLKSFDANNYSHTNIVEYNDIRYVNMETSDSAAIETLGRHKRGTGNVIQYNLIRDTGGLGSDKNGQLHSPYFTWGIYLDDYSSGTTVKGNIVIRHVLGGVCVHGGKDNIIENNIFVDGSEHQVRFQVRDTFCTGNRFTHNIISFKDNQADLYSSTGTWANSVLQLCDRNLFWHVQGAGYFNGPKMTPKGPFRLWQSSGFDKNSLIADPKFMNPGDDNYMPSNASPAKQLGFEDIPFDKIGLKGFERSWKK